MVRYDDDESHWRAHAYDCDYNEVHVTGFGTFYEAKRMLREWAVANDLFYGGGHTKHDNPKRFSEFRADMKEMWAAAIIAEEEKNQRTKDFEVRDHERLSEHKESRNAAALIIAAAEKSGLLWEVAEALCFISKNPSKGMSHVEALREELEDMFKDGELACRFWGEAISTVGPFTDAELAPYLEAAA
jgi:hypothetical protein